MFANIPVNKAAPSNAVANNTATQSANGGEKDIQPTESAQQLIHDIANDSAQVKQLRSIQDMANNSPQVKQLRAVQAMANDKDAGPVQKKENNTGLPDTLKSGIEGLSGYSMDDVKVHYNSAKPAQLNALAYAQGTDIHVASGQEKHLPHEAWHVVQQKQGRVQATMQMKGDVPVNDDKGLEQEADVMGAKAATFNEQGPAAIFDQAPALVSASAQLKVVQRLSSQIVINEDDEERKIVHVAVRGRPPRAHGSRMGDHTTAFIVHVEGLNIMLQGLTVYEAVHKLDSLNEHIYSLPSMKMANVDDVKHEMEDFNVQLARAMFALYNSNEDLAIHHLQLAINAYLRARELVPFSTINVAHVSQGLAGKGHGESGPASLLSQFERDQIELTDEDLVMAIKGLFDPQAAGMVAIEMDPGNVTGLVGRPIEQSEEGPMKRVEPIWQQHLLSIQAMFPKCFARVSDKLPVEDLEEKLSKLDHTNMEWSLRYAFSKLGELEKDLASLKLDFSGVTTLPQRGGKFVFAKLNLLAPLLRGVAKVQHLVPGLRRLDNRFKNKFAKEIETIEKRIRSLKEKIKSDMPQYDEDGEQDVAINTSQHFKKMMAQNSKAKKPKSSHHKNLLNLNQVVQGLPPSPTLPESYGSPAYTPLEEDEDDVDMLGVKPMETSGDHELKPEESLASSSEDHDLATGEEDIPENEEPEEVYEEMEAPEGTLTRATGPMTNQLLLASSEGGPRITGLLSSGRPASPFSKTMGAHSTAWVVHLDRVRRRLMGKTLNEAAAEMRLMIKETLDLYELLKDGTWGDNAMLLIKGAGEAINLAAVDKGKAATITQVQHMITCTLSFLNLLPTISQDSTRTTGNSEGYWRAILRDFEYEDKGTQDQVVLAIKNLYDDKGAKAWDRHENFIAQAYPRAAAFAKTGEIPPKEKGPGAQRPLSNDVEDSGGSGGGTKKLSPFELESLHSEYYRLNYLNPEVLAGINNCLFNAIADAAGIDRPTVEQVIRIREILNVPLGEMLTATRERLDVILLILGLQDRGAIVVYNHDEWMDTTTDVSEDALMIQHDGVNHFTAARQFMANNELGGSSDNIKKESGGKKRTID